MKTEINTSQHSAIEPDSLQAWVLAVRPRTLSASAAPVIMASALAYATGSFRVLPMVMCLAFALLAQMASNLANDYFDYKSGSDDLSKRIGPARAVASGWVSPSRMKAGLGIVVAAACASGLGLVFYGGWQMILVGVACVVALFAYSAGPFPASRHGLGDVMVLVFYGIVPVFFTFYLVSGFNPLGSGLMLAEVALGALAVGLASVNILVLNNYRDYDNDKAEGKKTTVVLFGRKAAVVMYLLNSVFAAVCAALTVGFVGGWSCVSLCLMALPLCSLFLMVKTLRGIVKAGFGPVLNAFLGKTSACLLMLVVLSSVAIVLVKNLSV